jgi:hypothetical protein
MTDSLEEPGEMQKYIRSLKGLTELNVSHFDYITESDGLVISLPEVYNLTMQIVIGG